MTSATLHYQALDLVLASMDQVRGEDGIECRFLYGKPGAPLFQRGLSTAVFFQRRLLVRAALFVRQSGPAYLRSMAITDIQSMLTTFMTDNYGYLSREIFSERRHGPYSERISVDTKRRLAELLSRSKIFKPPNELTLYPLMPVKVEDDFHSPSFFLVRAESLNNNIPGLERASGIVARQFPPIGKGWRTEDKFLSWLGVRSPIVQASSKMKAAILGALALTPHPAYRHLFSLRAMFGGRCTVDPEGGTIISHGEPHTPGMAEDIVVRTNDHAWLSMLEPKLLASEPTCRRHVRALEYYYRAWPLDAPERFAWLFMALDAIFGDVGSQATQAVIDAIEKHGEASFEYARLRLLLGLRNSVIHGGAPDVYDSDKYQRYYETYGDDPVRDLEKITASCLRSTIFEGALVEHPNPHADLIRDYLSGKLGRGKA